jgi:hypothetical protein
MDVRPRRRNVLECPVPQSMVAFTVPASATVTVVPEPRFVFHVVTNGTETVKLSEVTPLTPFAVKLRLWGPAPVIARSVNVATPFRAVTVVVPVSVPLPDAFVTVTASVLDVTVFPEASRMATTGCVVNGAPLRAPAAGARRATWVGRQGPRSPRTRRAGPAWLPGSGRVRVPWALLIVKGCAFQSKTWPLVS